MSMKLRRDSEYASISHNDSLGPRGPKRDATDPPRDVNLMLILCKAREARGMAEVADFMMAHPYDVAFGITTSIARRCGVSTTPVVRVAMRLGFDGFREMRNFFRDQLRDAGRSLRTPTF
jgi:hypothetical protein